MTTFTARTPVDLLALVPIVIGFHPEDSVVLLTFDTRPQGVSRAVNRGEAFQARVDLPVVEHEQRAVARILRDVAAQHQVRRAALVLYSDDAGAVHSFADLLVPDLLDDGVEVIEVLRVDGEHYFRVADPEDTGASFDLRSHPLTAAGVFEGRVVHESRNALRDTLVGTNAEEIQNVADVADAFAATPEAEALQAGTAPVALAAQARWLQATIGHHVDEPTSLSTHDAGRMVVLLGVDDLREVVWCGLKRANAPAHAEFFRVLVRRTPPEYVPALAGLLALAGWLAGDGALAWCAVDRSLSARPDDQLAQQVAMLLETATPPSVWAPMPVSALPVFTGARSESSGSCRQTDLASGNGARRRGTGVQPG